MYRIFILLLISFISIDGKAIDPTFRIKTKASVIDFIYEDNFVYVSTDGGTIEIFDFAKRKRIKEIVFPEIEDYLGEKIRSKIYSIDKLKGSDQLLAVVQRSDGFRDIYEYKSGKLTKVIDGNELKLMVKEARYIDTEYFLMGLLSNEIVKYSLKDRKIAYRVQVSTYSFSDLAMHESRNLFVCADESGLVRLYNSRRGEKVYTFESFNKDNIYQVDYKNGVLITAGQDRIVGVSSFEKSKDFKLETTFLVYSVGLSPKANFGAYYADEQNEIYVFDVHSHGRIGILQGHESVITRILFIDENMIISSAEDKELLVWHI